MKHILCLRELVLLASLVLVTSLMSGEVKSEPSVLERKIEILDQSGLEGLEESLLSEPETWVRLTSRTVVGASTSESRSYGTLVNKLRMKV
jgi:hypothetical protein